MENTGRQSLMLAPFVELDEDDIERQRDKTKSLLPQDEVRVKRMIIAKHPLANYADLN